MKLTEWLKWQWHKQLIDMHMRKIRRLKKRYQKSIICADCGYRLERRGQHLTHVTATGAYIYQDHFADPVVVSEWQVTRRLEK